MTEQSGVSEVDLINLLSMSKSHISIYLANRFKLKNVIAQF